MRDLSVFALLFVVGLAQAQTISSSADGNLIPEPELKDYQSASRSPGILAEPTDVVDANNQPVDL